MAQRLGTSMRDKITMRPHETQGLSRRHDEKHEHTKGRRTTGDPRTGRERERIQKKDTSDVHEHNTLDLTQYKMLENKRDTEMELRTPANGLLAAFCSRRVGQPTSSAVWPGIGLCTERQPCEVALGVCRAEAHINSRNPALFGQFWKDAGQQIASRDVDENGVHERWSGRRLDIFLSVCRAQTELALEIKHSR